MKIITCWIAVTLTLSMTLVTPSPTISTTKVKPVVNTQSKINTILAAVDRAATRKDADAITASMDPNVVIKATVQGRDSYTWNRAQYKSYLVQGFRPGWNYSYRRSNTRTSVARNGQSARVTSTVHASMKVGSFAMRGVSNESTTFQVRGGRILITSLNIVSRSDIVSRRQR
jgi:hypothetical protein